MQDILLPRTRVKERRHTKKRKITITLLSLAGITRLLLILAANNPLMVEKLYSASIYPYIARLLGIFSNLVSFSIAELLLFIMVFSVILIIVSLIIRPKFYLDNLSNIFHYTLRFLSIVYILFYFLWGFNYYREDYLVLASMNQEPATYQELKELTLEKIRKTNEVREDLSEDKNGIFFMDKLVDDLNIMANEGFLDYMVGDISLSGSFSRTKPVFLSKYMSYTGITGIYIPFTSEPNVNIDIPAHNLLTTISHEIAHQRGFAKEDEANFIAYKANTNNPDKRFQYSGYYMAMTHLINEIYRENREDYSLIYDEISDAVKRDIEYSRDYWATKRGKVEETVSNMNDNYLKANNQTEGVKSYNGVVKLLLAEYKSNNK